MWGTPSVGAAVDGLRVIRPDDRDDLLRVARHLARFPFLVDDAVRADPVAWFAVTFCNYNNLVFDMDEGKGFIAFFQVHPGWRASVYAASWDTGAMRRYDLWRAACGIAMLTYDLLTLDAFIHPDNRLAQRAAKRSGGEFRGRIKGATVYNGTTTDMLWYELRREDMGLPPVEYGHGQQPQVTVAPVAPGIELVGAHPTDAH